MVCGFYISWSNSRPSASDARAPSMGENMRSALFEHVNSPDLISPDTRLPGMAESDIAVRIDFSSGNRVDAMKSIRFQADAMAG